MAKAVSNKRDKSGKGKPERAGKGGKAPAKRSAAKPARKGQAARQQPARKAQPKERRGVVKFLRDVRVEMGKVTWPTRKDLVQSTIVVLVAVAIAAVYTGVLDSVFQQAVNLVMRVIT